MTEAHQIWAQAKQPARRGAVLCWVGREELRGFAQTRHCGEQIHVVQHVTDNQRSISLASVNDMTGRVPWCLDYVETADCSAFP